MATLQALVSLIEDDLARTNLATQVQAECRRAIEYYQKKLFIFKQSRDLSFSTIVDQFRYPSTTVLASGITIAELLEVDTAWLERSDGQRYVLHEEPHHDLEYFTDSTASKGEPYWYSRYMDEVWLYPVPQLTTYTVRFMGNYMLPAPTLLTDENAWTTEGLHLIRCRAKHFLYAHKIHDFEKARLMLGAEADAFKDLNEILNKKSGDLAIARSF